MSGGERDRRIAERDVADRRYGVELTKVDEALPTVSLQAPGVSIELDTRLVQERAAVPPSPEPDVRGWRGWLARFVWRLVAPGFARQQEHNVLVAAQLKATADAVRLVAAGVPTAGAADRDTLRTFLTFHSALVQLLQQVPAFVDTKARVLEASLDEVRMAAIAAQRTAQAASRQVELARTPGAAGPSPSGHGGDDRGPIGEHAVSSAFAASYVGFEDLFRGSETDIARRQSDYVDRFKGAARVLDIGCGRGEFLALLREAGIGAVGVDANPEMVEACRARGLEASQADALEYLAGLPDRSLDGVSALQVVEHLDPDRLVSLIRTAFDKLRPGGVIVLETINVACWVAFFESYVRDLTHVRPLHPDTLKFLVVAAGFSDVDVHFRSPVAEEGRLVRVETAGLPPHLAELARAFNANVERLNDRLFTYLDYAVIGTKTA